MVGYHEGPELPTDPSVPSSSSCEAHLGTTTKACRPFQGPWGVDQQLVPEPILCHPHRTQLTSHSEGRHF